MQYLVQTRDRIFVNGYGLLSFAKYLGQNIGKIRGKNVIKNFSGKCSPKRLDNAKRAEADSIKHLEKE